MYRTRAPKIRRRKYLESKDVNFVELLLHLAAFNIT
jgi:hypothetical protein